MEFSKEAQRGIRNSKMALSEVYFWTDTIKDWNHLLSDDSFKEIIIASWRNLASRNKIALYGFVIMPNHLHVIWEMKSRNGKEMPYASFNKFTSHQFLEKLEVNDALLLPYKVTGDIERDHRFWQRDPLAILMDSRRKVEQKLDYLHLNPLQSHWNLATNPEDYDWSSARYYETGKDDFGFLTHYMERF